MAVAMIVAARRRCWPSPCGWGLFAGSMIVTAIALVAISPPLVVAAYAVLRDQELEPYRGKELYIRSRGVVWPTRPFGVPLCCFSRVAS